MHSKDIINLTNTLQEEFFTNDPYKIAELCGIRVIFRNVNPKLFKAHTLKTKGYPTIISINSNYSTLSRKLLCAHELGHALLHDDSINHFEVTSKNIFTSIEYEANLFAVSLLFDENEFNIPISKITPYALKNILDMNIEVTQPN